MVVQLVGTGNARGWPEPGCGCASCRAAARAGPHRPLRVEVDGAPIPLGADPVPLGPALLVVPDPSRAPTGRAPGPAYDTVLLGCPDPRAFALGLAHLRRAGVAGPGTRVLAVGFTHACPPPAELGPLLTAMGAEPAIDGTTTDGTPVDAAPIEGPPIDSPAVKGNSPGPAGGLAGHQRVLLTGGARSGKSALAELLVSAEPEVLYLATGPVPDAGDPDWAARVETHRRRRPEHWQTLENTDLVTPLGLPGVPLLIDCLSLWLAAHLEEPAAVAALAAGWRNAQRRVVAVTSEVGSGVHPETALGRRYRDQLGRLNAMIAAQSDEVWLVTAGIGQRLR